MNAVSRNFRETLDRPGSRLTQELRLWIGRTKHDLDVLDFKVKGGFCKDYRVDVTVTSSQLDIDGKECVGLRVGLRSNWHEALPGARADGGGNECYERQAYSAFMLHIAGAGVDVDEVALTNSLQPKSAVLEIMLKPD